MLSLQTSFIDLPSVYAFGLQNTFYSNNQLLIYPGQARSNMNEFDIVLPSGTFLNTSINGVNGLDTGTVSANTWYSVYVIGDSTLIKPSGCLLSAQQKITGNIFTSPILPGGYSHYRRIGWALTDSSANLISFDMAYNNETGNNCYRYYQWDTPRQVLSSGTSTSFISVNLGSALPYNERGTANLAILYTNSVTTTTASIRPTGSLIGIGSCPINVSSTVSASVTNPQFPSCWMTWKNLISNFPSLDYAVTGGSLSIWVNGYYDCI